MSSSCQPANMVSARSLLIRRAIECALLFIGVPLLMWMVNVYPPSAYGLPMLEGIQPRRLLFPLLWLLAIWIWILWRRAHPGQKLVQPLPKYDYKSLFLRYLLCCALMSAFLYLYDPDRLAQFVRMRPGMWLFVMVLYPLLSVVPQELVYRVFFCSRYAMLFGQERGMIIASGLAFGFGHLLFNNWVAVIFSVVGGMLFASTYLRSGKSFSLLWLEHAIYGQFVFTIGLGWYFYSGAATMH